MGHFARTQASQSQVCPVSLSRADLSHLTLSDCCFRRQQQQLTNEEIWKVIYFLNPEIRNEQNKKPHENQNKSKAVAWKDDFAEGHLGKV